MPLVRIDTRDDTPREARQAIADGVHRALISAIGIPAGDRFQIIYTHPADEIIFDPTYLGIERRNVTYVQITLVRGRTPERKKQLYREIVANLAADAGIRPQDVVISLTENEPVDWSIGNGVAQLVDDTQ